MQACACVLTLCARWVHAPSWGVGMSNKQACTRPCLPACLPACRLGVHSWNMNMDDKLSSDYVMRAAVAMSEGGLSMSLSPGERGGPPAPGRARCCRAAACLLPLFCPLLLLLLLLQGVAAPARLLPLRRCLLRARACSLRLGRSLSRVPAAFQPHWVCMR